MRKQISTTSLLMVLLLWCPSLTAQKAKVLKAEQYLETLRYDDALRIYHRLYRKDNHSVAAVVGLANSYQKSGQLDQAASWFEKAITLPEVDPEVYFSYGQILLTIEDCSLAQAVFDQYLIRKPYDERRSSIEDVCTYVKQLTDDSQATTQVSLLDFNGPGSDIAPAFFEDGIVFGSVRTSDEKKTAFYDLYFASSTIAEEPGALLDFSSIKPFSEIINSDFNEAIITFSPDEQELYFTRNQDQKVSDKNPLRRLEIRVSRIGKDNVWSNPERLNFNSVDFNNAHPSLSPDGNQLYFSSDRPGGFGGKDIYRCDRYGMSWGTPVNLGPRINTAGDELYPSLHSDGILYFASNGHLGLGGLDVFRAEDQGRGLWDSIINLGAPVNSSADDFGLIIDKDGEYGFFTSNREGGVGSDDIYIFQQKKIDLQLQFTDVDNKPLQSGVAFIINGQDYLTFSANNGHWHTWLEPDGCLRLRVQDDRFEASEMEICASSSTDNEKLIINWPLSALAKDLPVYAAKGGATYFHGTIYDELSAKPIAGANIKLKSVACNKYIDLTTDENGSFSYGFSDDCCYEVTVTKEGYFASTYDRSICQQPVITPNDIAIKMTPYRLKKEHQLTQQADSGEHFQVGTQVYEDASDAIPYRLNIYYDLGRSSVRTEAIPELNRLYFIMLNNPKITIEVSSHTDARGSSQFNKNLSQRRATAIVSWLASKGIDKNRLIARGYGEDRLVNKCRDGIECEEEEHQMNRRTEFRVLDQQLGHSY